MASMHHRQWFKEILYTARDQLYWRNQNFEVVKGALNLVPLFPVFSKIDLICLTPCHWQPCVSKFCDIRKGWLCKLSFRISNAMCDYWTSIIERLLIQQEILLSHPFPMSRNFRAKSTDCDKLTSNQQLPVTRHKVILLLSEGLGKMIQRILKSFYDRSSLPIGVSWLAVSCRGPRNFEMQGCQWYCAKLIKFIFTD